MSFKEEFMKDVSEGLAVRIEEQGFRPNVEIWPEEDDFGRWVASHGNGVIPVVCNSPEFKDAPFCGRGLH
jgi:hypothetical protein